MVDVRKCFIVLALFALIAGGAFAQVTCTVGTTQNQNIRAAGLTEQAGVIQLNCVNPGDPVNVSFSAIMSTTISNQINGASVAQGAALQVGTASSVSGVLQTRPGLGNEFRNQIIFTTVQIPTVASPGTTVTISGIRVVAPPVSTSFTNQTVSETITTTGATLATTGANTTVTIPNPVQIVGTVQAGVVATLTDCSGNAGNFSVATFAQCVSEPSTAGASWNGNIKFTEGFVNAFRNQADEGSDAKNPTLLVANFTKIPAGARVFVTNTAKISSTNAPLPPAGSGLVPSAALDDSTDTLRSSLPSSITPPICTLANPTISTVAGDWSELTVTNGTATANWAVENENPSFTDSMQFGILIVFTANTASSLPGVTSVTGPAQVSAELGPIAGPAFASTSSSQAIPRFTENFVFTGNLFTISPCVTNLLFPYVTLGGGFDTGIAISNTSLDQSGTTGAPFTTTTQSGTCTAFYFTKPTATQVAPQTTSVIAAGEVLAFALSQGGVPGATSTVPANFTGYMIVRCNFQFAHGFAFVSDLGAQKLAQGYLALVIPDSTPRKPTPISTYSGKNVGESLGN